MAKDGEEVTIRPGRSGNFDRQRSPKFSAAREEIKRRKAALAEEGKPYPSRTVDEIDPETTVWWGRVPYDVESLERIRRSAADRQPVRLPDDYVLDGDRQLPGESDEGYRRYCAWRDLGPGRSLGAAARSLGLDSSVKIVNTYWGVMSRRYRWRERLALWEADLNARTQAAIEAKIDQSVDHYAESRTKYLERELSLVQATIDRLEEMLSLPIITQIVEEKDGKTIHHYHPANWDYRAVAAVLAEVHKIGRLHFGLSTSNASQKIEQSLSGTVTHTVADGNDSRNMSPEERAAHDYAARKAEDAYFAALAEYQGRSRVPAIDSVATVAAG